MKEKQLLDSALNNDMDELKRLLGESVDLETRDEEGCTAFMLAAKKGHLLIIKELLNAGANIDVQGKYGHTALILAAMSGHLPIVEELLKKHANFELFTATEKTTALMNAAAYGHLEIVQLLLKEGADPRAESIYGTALNLVIGVPFYDQLPHRAAVIEALLQAGTNIESRSRDGGQTPLLAAAELGDEAMVQKLLHLGANIHARSDNGFTPLIAAVRRNGNNRIVKDLLMSGARIDDTTNEGQTALIIAAQYGFLDLVNALLIEGANKEVQAQNGYTALMHAAENGHLKIVEALLIAGANKEAKGQKGNTALQLAQLKRHEIIVNLLKKFPTFEYRLEKIGYEGGEINIDFKCPISLVIMNDPIAVSSGQTYDRESLESLFKSKGNPDTVACPVTRLPINKSELKNETHVLTKKMIDRFVCAKEKEFHEAKADLSDRKTTKLQRTRSVGSFFDGKNQQLHETDPAGKPKPR